MKGLFPLSSIISSFKPIDTSIYSIEPGNRVDLPNIILVRFTYTKYFVSVNSVESAASGDFSTAEGSADCYYKVRLFMMVYRGGIYDGS